jgi:ATP-dependent Zn protease
MSGIGKVFFALIIAAAAVMIWQVARVHSTAQAVREISYSDFSARVTSDQIKRVTIAGSAIRGSDTNGNSFRVVAPSNQAAMMTILEQHRGRSLVQASAGSELADLVAESGPAYCASFHVVFPDPPEAEATLR